MPSLEELKRDYERGWEPFEKIGTRVEVREVQIIGGKGVPTGRWVKGTVVEPFSRSERGISVICDEIWHDDAEFYGGRGYSVMVFDRMRKQIQYWIRRIKEPRRDMCLMADRPTPKRDN